MSELEHYGTPRHSGRYPWGSGDNPYQHSPEAFMSAIFKMQKDGMSEVQIAKAMNISTSTLRARRSAATNAIKAARSAQAFKLKEKGMSNSAIARRFGVNESTIRGYLSRSEGVRENAVENTANVLRDAIKEQRFVDVGAGVNAHLGVSETRLKSAVQFLKDEGYKQFTIKYRQLGTGYMSDLKVLAAPDVKFSDVARHKDDIGLPFPHEYLEDNGMTRRGIKPPVSVDPSRLEVRFAEDGGKNMDGVIQIRRGVPDLSLGDARYAQVRIRVGENKYLKGMAMYTDDLPDGVDLRFNTNKFKADHPDKLEALKTMEDDPDNPFKATIRQRTYIDADGNEQLSALNIVGNLKTANEEGGWGGWSKTISSQVLSKQPVPLIKKRLDETYKEAVDELDEISKLTNPEVKKLLLQKYAEQRDSDAVHLKAAGFPRQAWHVILPIEGIPDDEVYAPNYHTGETVVLIRHPHGGRFEIPTLRVNNENAKAKSLIEGAADAVGISPKVAERLSGADFDGDTVLVIPNNDGAIKTAPALSQLKDFDPKEAYPAYDGMPKVGPKTGFHKQTEMGKVSNLITDMTIKGATTDEIARAVKHSMVVIDAEKHNLNWRQSAIDNQIRELKQRYQGGANAGASTLISRAKGEVRVPQRKLETTLSKKNVDPETGERIYTETGETYTKTDAKGRTKEYKSITKIPRMLYEDDAFNLSSGTKVEDTYAQFANNMRALGRKARLEFLDTPSQKYNPSAKEAYSKEVASLNAKLQDSVKNKPLERQAQVKANAYYSAAVKDNPDMSKEDRKKLRSQALEAERAKTGASKYKIEITPKEWEAIQSGAVSANTLSKILANTDIDVVRSYATPKSSGGLKPSDISRAKAMLATGVPQSEVAQLLGVSTSTLHNAISE